MLTAEVEGGIQKADAYWPTEDGKSHRYAPLIFSSPLLSRQAHPNIYFYISRSLSFSHSYGYFGE